MTGILLRSQIAVQTALNSTLHEVFCCPEESHFYAYCLERLVLAKSSNSDVLIEFGSGDGSPVIQALLRANFNGKIYGYELNSAAQQVAQAQIQAAGVDHQYTVYHESFFEAKRPSATYLVANPPYLPSPDDDIYMPLLFGGTDGATITNRLLTLGYPHVMSLLASYSNPIETIDHALAQGYVVSDFMVTPLKFGYYSSQPKVKNHIAELRENGQAFYSPNIYLLAGVLFTQEELSDVDLSDELIQLTRSIA